MSNHSEKFCIKLGNSPVLHHISKLAQNFRKLGNSLSLCKTNKHHLRGHRIVLEKLGNSPVL